MNHGSIGFRSRGTDLYVSKGDLLESTFEFHVERIVESLGKSFGIQSRRFVIELIPFRLLYLIFHYNEMMLINYQDQS